MNEDWVPTARLRFVERVAGHLEPAQRILQQYWAADVPGYMRRDAEGEWRDVVVVEETAP